MTSAYPIEIQNLLSRVQARAVELGRLPSRNRVMAEFKVGAPKARSVLATLKSSGWTPAGTDTANEGTARRLHSVPPSKVEAPEPAPEVGPDTAPETDAASAPVEVEVSTPVDPVPAAPERHADQAPAVAVSAPVTEPSPTRPVAAVSRVRTWPLLLLAAGAFVSIWGGWVGLGKLTGFGPITLLPGIADGFVINSAITLPIGVEAYAAFALRVWLASGHRPAKARTFAMWSAIGSLVLGMAGQVAYHLMTAAGIQQAPWQITTFVSCLPVVVLGCGAALAHLLHTDEAEASR